MTLRLLMASASAVLFLFVPRTAGAQDSQQGAAMPGHAVMQQNANESAQATTDMSFGENGQAAPAQQSVQNVSYGGVAGGRSETSGRDGRPCSDGPQCKVYFGQ